MREWRLEPGTRDARPVATSLANDCNRCRTGAAARQLDERRAGGWRVQLQSWLAAEGVRAPAEDLAGREHTRAVMEAACDQEGCALGGGHTE